MGGVRELRAEFRKNCAELPTWYAPIVAPMIGAERRWYSDSKPSLTRNQSKIVLKMSCKREGMGEVRWWRRMWWG